MNNCGSCTKCCKIMGVASIGKRPGVWCQHCAIGKGCKIYDTRPRECQEFECLWLQGQKDAPNVFTPELRPDHSHVVIDTNADVVIVYTDPAYPLAWQEPKMLKLIQALAATSKAKVVVGPVLSRKRILLEYKQGIMTKKTIMLSEPDAQGRQSYEYDSTPPSHNGRNQDGIAIMARRR